MKTKFLCLVMCVLWVGTAFSDLPTFTWTNSSQVLNLKADAQVSLDLGTSNAAFNVSLVTGKLNGSIYEGVSAPTTNVYKTFCVENGIYFNPGWTYYATIDSVAYSGHYSGIQGDPISAVSEWVYDKFRNNALGSYTLVDARDAIWYAENEGGANNLLYQQALAAVGSGNASHTYALNLWTLTQQPNGSWTATDVQSQLITTAPVPAAVLLGFLGLSVAGIKLRKMA